MNDHFRKRFCRVLAFLLIAGMSGTVRAEEGPNTFEGDGGRYDLGYILEHYNVFVSGDYDGTHVVGPVICGGSFRNFFGGLSVGNVAGYPHEVPSWFRTDIASSNFGTYSDVPTYVGSSVDMNHHWKLGADGMVHNEQVKVSDSYADFARMEDLKNQALSLGKEADRTISSQDLENTMTLILETGHTYKIESGISLKGYSIQVSGNASEDLILESDASGTVYLPTFVLNSDGSQFGSIENQKSGAGIVFAFPNASEVTNEGYGQAITGHIVAPFAHVSLGGGNYNGCIIAASVTTNSEGHMWSYHGKKLLPTPTPEVTPVPSATPAPTSAPEVTPVPSSTPEPTATPEVIPVPSDAPAPTATPEVTPVPSATPEPTATPEVTPVPSATPEPTATPEVTPVPSATPEPTATPEVTPVPSATPEPTATPEVTPVPSATPEPTATPEVTPVPSATPAPTATPEVTPVPSATPEPTATPEVTPVPSATPEPTATPEVTPVPTETPAPTATPEVTPVPSATPEPTATPEVTPVPSATPTPTATPDVTPAPSSTPVPSPTPKTTPVPSSTPASSAPAEKPVTPNTSSGSYIVTAQGRPYTPNTADHSGIAENALRLIGSLVIAGWAWKSLKR